MASFHPGRETGRQEMHALTVSSRTSGVSDLPSDQKLQPQSPVSLSEIPLLFLETVAADTEAYQVETAPLTADCLLRSP